MGKPPYTSTVKRIFLLFLLLSAISGSSLDSAPERFKVVFLDGATLLAEGIREEGRLTLLTLPGGGQVGVASERIARIEEMPPAPGVSASPGEERAEAGLPETPATPPDPEPSSAHFLGRVPQAAPEPILALIREAAARHQVDAELLRCLIQVESAYDSRAVSPKGARGLAQLMPGTAADLGVEDPFDPAEAVDAAARHLKELLSRNDGAFVPALAAYNAGEGAVRRYGGVPPYAETIRYVEKILTLYAAP